MLAELLANGFLEGARIGLAALGFCLIFYTTQHLHFAYGVMLVGCGYLHHVGVVELGLPPLVAAAATILVGAAAGMLLQWGAYSRLDSHLSVLLFSFGLAIVLENVLHLLFGSTDKVMPAGALSRTIELAGARFRLVDLVALTAFTATALGVWALMRGRRTGLALRAVMRDAAMSTLAGIPVERIRLLAYGLGSGIAAVAGIIAVTRTGVRPSGGFDIMLFAFIATLLAAGRLVHVVAWSLGLGVFMGAVAWVMPTELRTLMAFALMLTYLVGRSVEPGRLLSRLRPSRPTRRTQVVS